MPLYYASMYLLYYFGVSESFTFNKLENIANSVFPTTPVLGNCITKALRPEYVGDQVRCSMFFLLSK